MPAPFSCFIHTVKTARSRSLLSSHLHTQTVVVARKGKLPKLTISCLPYKLLISILSFLPCAIKILSPPPCLPLILYLSQSFSKADREVLLVLSNPQARKEIPATSTTMARQVLVIALIFVAIAGGLAAKAPAATPKSSPSPKSTPDAPTEGAPKASAEAPKADTPESSASAPKSSADAPRTSAGSPKSSAAAAKGSANAPKSSADAPEGSDGAPESSAVSPSSEEASPAGSPEADVSSPPSPTADGAPADSPVVASEGPISDGPATAPAADEKSGATALRVSAGAGVAALVGYFFF